MRSNKRYERGTFLVCSNCMQVSELRASDVDLAIKGASVTYDTAVKLADVLNEETPLPYFFDVIHYESVVEPRLVEHIDRVGIVLYSKEA